VFPPAISPLLGAKAGSSPGPWGSLPFKKPRLLKNGRSNGWP